MFVMIVFVKLSLYFCTATEMYNSGTCCYFLFGICLCGHIAILLYSHIASILKSY